MKVNLCKHILSPLSDSSGNYIYPKTSKSLIISGVALTSIFTFGATYAIFLAVTYCKKINNPADLTKPSSTSSSSTSIIETIIFASDASVILKLKQQGFLSPIERGGGGDCLFLSIAPQITQEDLDFLNDDRLSDWDTCSELEKANLLRMLALEAEHNFMASLEVDMLTEDDNNWINELYKDILQELQNPDLSIVRKQSKKTPFEEKIEFCKTHFTEYKKRTSIPHNWAGTSEMIAIGRVFNRKMIAYGRDFAQSQKLAVNSKGEVLPYYKSLSGELPPIYVFQCGGGGHYRQLAKAPADV